EQGREPERDLEGLPARLRLEKTLRLGRRGGCHSRPAGWGLEVRPAVPHRPLPRLRGGDREGASNLLPSYAGPPPPPPPPPRGREHAELAARAFQLTEACTTASQTGRPGATSAARP